MKFDKELLLEKLDGRDKVLDILKDSTRWSLHYRFVFKHEGKLYETHYSIGSTEMQDEGPWEYEDEDIDCQEVEAFEKTVTDYRTV